MAKSSLPQMPSKILLLSTGGTIAGLAPNSGTSSIYTPAELSADSLLATLPLSDYELSVKEIAQIDSVDMDFEVWSKLVKAIEEAKDVAGIVITHGTDSMEESVLFLSVVLEPKVPIVLVGAMRPSNAIGSDGSKNLCNALALATQAKAGVYVLNNDFVFDYQVRKSHTHNLNAFTSPAPMGYVLDGKYFANYEPSAKPHLPMPQSLPKVECVYTYAGIEEFALSEGVQGVVLVGSGAGSIPSKLLGKLNELERSGISIVICTRVAEGRVVSERFIPSFSLTPPKARILLALCIANGLDKEEMKRMFEVWG